MATLRFIAGDQLSPRISALDGADKARDVIVMAEVDAETRYVPHHKQKIAFILSAMRHFAGRLRQDGYQVDYIRLDDPRNTGSFRGEIGRAVHRHGATRIVATWPGEWRVLEDMRGWSQAFTVPVEIREDDRFMCTRGEFAAWAKGRSQLRMEFFYRDMRRRTGLMMEGDQPAGGAWNFDSDNRKALPRGAFLPARLRFAPDAITQEAIALVAQRHADHFGALEGFGWPVTREDALLALDHFIRDCLPHFGAYQDAMKQGEGFLHHSLLSAALNVGLLEPMEVCRAAEVAWRKGHAPLNAAEGFIRQIIGWREYVRGLYWLKMPGYAQSNALEARRPLPGFYWTGKTDMACLRDAIATTQAHAYAHHIQRLMLTGNFALLAGVAPKEIEAWYLSVYVDAFDWVELPNTHGMAIFADGGVMASKPYAASGAYVKRMSDYCAGCRYDPGQRIGPKACPLNSLYWNFLIANEGKLAQNPRMAMPYKNLARMSEGERAAIVAQATGFLEGLKG